ncbi:hypothetical protein [Pseudoroseicyclus sp. CXY001]|uniref:hypothetical protein n=1 Tax=Pseudoroseicyclus sp. CXY001 TaxID=3242492 RepID=UPI003571249F
MATALMICTGALGVIAAAISLIVFGAGWPLALCLYLAPGPIAAGLLLSAARPPAPPPQGGGPHLPAALRVI